MGVVVVKIGTSSVTTEEGFVDVAAIARLCEEVAAVQEAGHRVIVVTSGAVAAGLTALGYNDGRRPVELALVQAVAAVGQSRLMRVYDEILAKYGLVSGQVLLTAADFVDRSQYLRARGTLLKLLQMGVVPVVNENDAIAYAELRFGDNDNLAALLAHLVHAELLVLLTDTPGLYTADPRLFEEASLIEEIMEVDHELEKAAGGTVDWRSRGGMASKLGAAKIAAWSGVRCVIAAAERPGVLAAAVAGEAGVGTVIRPRARRLPARKLWIAFAVGPTGKVVVDDGARKALVERGTSLLPAGVVDVAGSFDAEAAVEIVDTAGRVFAKGLASHPANRVREWAGRRTGDLPADAAHEVVHRDNLVVLPA